jgi:hypothetical protein
MIYRRYEECNIEVLKEIHKRILKKDTWGHCHGSEIKPIAMYKKVENEISLNRCVSGARGRLGELSLIEEIIYPRRFVLRAVHETRLFAKYVFNRWQAVRHRVYLYRVRRLSRLGHMFVGSSYEIRARAGTANTSSTN